MQRCLLDTDIFSEVLKARDARVVDHARAYQSVAGPLVVSAVTYMEVIKGLHKRRHQDLIRRLSLELASLSILPFTTETAEIAGRIYADLESNGQTIGRADPMIAATAIQHELTLVTGNTIHFKRIQQLGYLLQSEDWRE